MPRWKPGMRLRLLDQAKADLAEQIQHYREAGGERLASKMLAKIKGNLLALKDNPGMAPPYELAPGVRCLVVAGGAFLVFYRVRADVEVLHIRRAERAAATVKDMPHA